MTRIDRITFLLFKFKRLATINNSINRCHVNGLNLIQATKKKTVCHLTDQSNFRSLVRFCLFIPAALDLYRCDSLRQRGYFKSNAIEVNLCCFCILRGLVVLTPKFTSSIQAKTNFWRRLTKFLMETLSNF